MKRWEGTRRSARLVAQQPFALALEAGGHGVDDIGISSTEPAFPSQSPSAKTARLMTNRGEQPSFEVAQEGARARTAANRRRVLPVY
jgi:hypothetical protein